MALANVTLLDSFDTWRTRTNQIIVKIDQIEGNVANSINVSRANVQSMINVAYANVANSIARSESNVANAIAVTTTGLFPKAGNDTITGNVTITGQIVNLL